MQSDVVLQTKNLTKTFRPDSPDPAVALAGVSVEVKTGELLVIVGSNGSGKTTLLNAIAGTVRPDDGTVIVDGADITEVNVYRRASLIARVFQDPADSTAGYLTVAENLALAAKRSSAWSLRWCVSRERRAEAEGRLAQVGIGLEDKIDTQVRFLSGGQRQAVALQMAAMATPRVMLLDEHTSALDPQASRKVIDLTRSVARETKAAVLMVTHSLQLALSVASRLVVMDSGRVIAHAEREELDGMTVQDLVCLFARAGAEPPADSFF